MAWSNETDRNRALRVITHAFEADGAGAVAAVVTQHTYKGFVVGVRIDEDAADPPDDNWDLTITDANGVDVLNGGGVNITADKTLTQTDLANGIAITGLLTLSAAQMGANNNATVHLYIASYDD